MQVQNVSNNQQAFGLNRVKIRHGIVTTGIREFFPEAMPVLRKLVKSPEILNAGGGKNIIIFDLVFEPKLVEGEDVFMMCDGIGSYPLYVDSDELELILAPTKKIGALVCKQPETFWGSVGHLIRAAVGVAPYKTAEAESLAEKDIVKAVNEALELLG